MSECDNERCDGHCPAERAARELDYSPTDKVHFEAPNKAAFNWRIFAQTVRPMVGESFDVNPDWMSLRMHGEPMFMTREHAFLLWKEIGEVLKEMRTCLDCGSQYQWANSRCYCEDDD